MSSYAVLYLGNLKAFTFRNVVDPSISLLFRRGETRVRTVLAGNRYEDADDPDEEVEVVEAVVPVQVLRDRLSTLGFSEAASAVVFRRLLADRSTRLRSWRVHDPEGIGKELAAGREKELEAIEDLTLESWREQVRGQIHDGEGGVAPVGEEEIGSLSWLLALWEVEDPRLLLRALADSQPECDVVLDVTDLVVGGWYHPEEDPRLHALSHFTWIAASTSPAIVLVEGITDAEFLQYGLEVTKPHLVDFVRFADFSFKPEGGAPALVRQVKALAAAGVPNRVLALFDNDTAAADAMRPLAKDDLPPNFALFTYPDRQFTAEYPTLGPDGPRTMDINGLACSIELYLGEDVLTDEGGGLRPIQWTGFVRSLGRYQGEVVDKSKIHDLYRAKAKSAIDSLHTRDEQDWSGMEAILDHVLDALKNMHAPDQ